MQHAGLSIAHARRLTPDEAEPALGNAGAMTMPPGAISPFRSRLEAFDLQTSVIVCRPIDDFGSR
jgi:hypothetical protein